MYIVCFEIVLQQIGRYCYIPRGKTMKYPSNITASCLEPEEGSVTITRLMHQLIGTS